MWRKRPSICSAACLSAPPPTGIAWMEGGFCSTWPATFATYWPVWSMTRQGRLPPGSFSRSCLTVSSHCCGSDGSENAKSSAIWRRWSRKASSASAYNSCASLRASDICGGLSRACARVVTATRVDSHANALGRRLGEVVLYVVRLHAPGAFAGIPQRVDDVVVLVGQLIQHDAG